MSVGTTTNKPIIDRAEVSLDIEHKLCMGSFGRDSVSDARADAHGLHRDALHDAARAFEKATRRTRRRKNA